MKLREVSRCLPSADYLRLIVTVPCDADIVSGPKGEAVAVAPRTIDDSDRAVGPWKNEQMIFSYMKMSFIPLIP